MAEHCHFISSFSLRIWVHACGGLDGPRAPAHTCSPQRTLGYRRSTLIYISPSQISLYLKKKSQWQLSEAVSLRITGTPEDSFNDGSILCSQSLRCSGFLYIFGLLIICYIQCVPICTTQEAAQATWIQMKSKCVVSGTFLSFVFITSPKHVFNLSRSMIFHFQVVASRQCQRKYILVPFTLHLKKMNTHCQMQILFKIIHFGTTHV